MDPSPVGAGSLAALAPLFAEHRELRAVIDSVLEGRLGCALSDSSSLPAAAALDLGCYRVLGGDPATPIARRLVAEAVAPRELIVPGPGGWMDLALSAHGRRAARDPMRGFDPSTLEERLLEEAVASLPAGYELRRLDLETSALLGPELSPHGLEAFSDGEDFDRRGLGFGAFRGSSLAAAATSYAVCSGRLEVAIATRREHRRRGLARSVAARLLLHCLKHGVSPCWNAANPISQHLALTLGYRPAGVCHSIRLAAE